LAEVLLFHHAQGLTSGVHAFADELRVAGHIVHTPDLFDGQTFSSIDKGMAHIESVGFDELRARGVHTADELPMELVYAGF
jgi:dienelactone hydrolase